MSTKPEASAKHWC